MPTTVPPIHDEGRYDKAAQEYLRKLPLEHFAEWVPHAKQREVTLASLDLLHARRPEVQIFNELLVQYPRPGKKKLGQVVPDYMVVVCSEPIKAEWSYDLPLQPVLPFWVLDYVSKGTKRKDYLDNRRMYEEELKVPYHLVFDPLEQDLTIYRHTGKAFTQVDPDPHGRYPIKELDLSVAVLGGWARFWYQGELLLLPAEMWKVLETQKRLDEAQKRIAAAEREQEQLRAQLQELQSRPRNGRK